MITVVVPAYNEEVGIKTCLDALVRQDFDEKYEVIVVNNNSTDKTKDVVMSYSSKLPLIRVVDEPKKGRGAARAAGFNSAKGDIILSTDADTIVPPNWISSMVRIFKNKEIKAVSGLCSFYDCPPQVNIFLTPLLPLIINGYRLIYGHYWLSGFNFGIRKEVYHESGGFATDLNAQEDTEFSARVAKYTKIYYSGNIKVICSGRRFKNGLFRGLYEYIDSFLIKKPNESYLDDVRE